MAKHALPRALSKLLSDDRGRGRGRSKHAANLTLLELYEEQEAEHKLIFGSKSRFSVRAFLRWQKIEQHVGGGLNRPQAERLVDKPSQTEREEFAAHAKTLSNRLAKARQHREMMMMKQAKLSRELRTRKIRKN